MLKKLNLAHGIEEHTVQPVMKIMDAKMDGHSSRCYKKILYLMHHLLVVPFVGHTA